MRHDVPERPVSPCLQSHVPLSGVFLPDSCAGASLTATCTAPHHLAVAELGLGLTLKLRFHHLNRDYGCEAFAEVIRVDFNLGVFEQVVIFGIFLRVEVGRDGSR